MARLTAELIKLRIEQDLIGVTPMPTKFTGVTFDVHLGNELMVPGPRRRFPERPPVVSTDMTRAELAAYTEQAFVKRDITSSPYLLKRGEFCLGVTRERIRVPVDLVGYLDGRSTLARLGLMVHVTAHRIDPGWDGNIVLEFYNCGIDDILLVGGSVIGAVSFETLVGGYTDGYIDRPDASYANQSGVVGPGGSPI